MQLDQKFYLDALSEFVRLARLKLTKSDPKSGGEHHFLGSSSVNHVEADKVCLNTR